MRDTVIIIYIIGGFVLLCLAVYLLDRREKLTTEIKEINRQKEEINELNQQLDEVQLQLNQLHEPIVKVHDISSKILFYMKK